MRRSIPPVVIMPALVLLLGTLPATPVSANPAQRASHLLDYIAVDYPEAVRDGEIVNALEYAEQLEFVAQVGAFLGELEGDPSEGGLGRLEDAIRARAAADVVGAEARALSETIRTHYGVRVSLRAPPQPEAGAALFALHCANCHGAEGRGDGAAGAGLDPAPSDFGDTTRMAALSPFTLYSTISFGIAGTGMVGYSTALSERERLDLTFFAATLANPPDRVEAGRRHAERDPARASALVPSLDALFDLVPQTLSREDRDVVAYLMATPDALRGGSLRLEIARSHLAQARTAHRAGDASAAIDHAIAAYLDGFEAIEPALSLVDAELRDEAEIELMAVRSILRDNPDPRAIEAPYARILALFDQSEAALGQGGLTPAATFLASFAILAREGLEAILLVAAILAIVSRAEGAEALRGRRAVHLGWVGALLCGAATWWAASRLIALSGARREIIEGIAALAAAAVLVWVSYWLFSRLDVERWQAFLAARLEAAAAAGSLWVLGALAFLAVYREAFETVLFYQALAVQGAQSQTLAFWGGIGAALALLAAAGTAILALGRRLPLRPFFALSSVLLYVFAVIFAGQGMAALQEAGAIDATRVAGFPRVAWLGLFPTLEGLGLQGLLLILAIAAIPLSGLRRSLGASAS